MSGAGYSALTTLRVAAAACLVVFIACTVVSNVVLSDVALRKPVFMEGAPCIDGVAPDAVLEQLEAATGLTWLSCTCSSVATHTPGSSDVNTTTLQPSRGITNVLLGWATNSAAQSGTVTWTVTAGVETAGGASVSTDPGMAHSCGFTQWPQVLWEGSDWPSGPLTLSVAAPGPGSAGAWACRTNTPSPTLLLPGSQGLWDALETPPCVSQRGAASAVADAAGLVASLLLTTASLMRRSRGTAAKAATARAAKASATAGGASTFRLHTLEGPSLPAVGLAVFLLVGNSALGGLALGKVLLQPLRCGGGAATGQWNELMGGLASSSVVVSLTGIALALPALTANWGATDTLQTLSAWAGGSVVALFLLLLLPHLLSGGVVFIGLLLLYALALAIAGTLLSAIVGGLVVAWGTLRPPPPNSPPPMTFVQAASTTGAGVGVVGAVAAVVLSAQLAAVVLRFGQEDTLCGGVGPSIELGYIQGLPWEVAATSLPDPAAALVTLNIGLSALVGLASQYAPALAGGAVALLACTTALCCARRRAGGDSKQKGQELPDKV